MAKFGKYTVATIKEQIDSLMVEQLGEIEKAYLAHGDETFKIGFACEVVIDESGANEVKTVMKYRPEPDRKSERKDLIDEEQGNLFPVDN